MEGLVRRRARILNTLVTTGAPQATDGSMRDRRTRGRSHQCMAERLRQRIFKATRDGDWAKVRNLQKLMLRSLSNTLVSVRQVTQGFSGRRLPLPSGQSYPPATTFHRRGPRDEASSGVHSHSPVRSSPHL